MIAVEVCACLSRLDRLDGMRCDHSWTALRPVDGAGTWQHTPSHSDTRWTLLGALFLGALCGLALAVLYFGGQKVVCWSDKAMTGKVAHSYCDGFVPEQVQR